MPPKAVTGLSRACPGAVIASSSTHRGHGECRWLDGKAIPAAGAETGGGALLAWSKNEWTGDILVVIPPSAPHAFTVEFEPTPKAIHPVAASHSSAG